MVNKHQKVAIVVGKEPPAMSVSWAPPISANDSGYCVIFSEIDPEEEWAPRGEVICMHCALEDGGEQLGRGLDLARKHGQVDYDPHSEEWFVPEYEDSVEFGKPGRDLKE
jgi:hypothetical protein